MCAHSGGVSPGGEVPRTNIGLGICWEVRNDLLRHEVQQTRIFKAPEALFAEQLTQLDVLRNDDGLNKEVEFEQKLRPCWVITASLCAK